MIINYIHPETKTSTKTIHDSIQVLVQVRKSLFYLLIVDFKNKISPGHTLLIANGTRGMHIHVTEYISIQIHMFLFPL